MKLVIGATGFLGSRVVRLLLADGERVRVLVRASSDTSALDELDVERVVGELTDATTVAAAMRGCEVVFYCAVDTRAWLRDSAPLYATNVTALNAVLDVAVAAGLDKFVFTSSMATIGRRDGHPVDETAEFDWDAAANDYVRTRVAGERAVLEAVRSRGLPAVAMCVANTYGEGDRQPTPHGSFVAGAALGKLPFTVRGLRSESVGVDDAARALVLAGAHGRPGERYIVAERSIDLGEVVALAAEAGGRPVPRLVLHRYVLLLVGAAGSALAWVTGRAPRLTLPTVRLMYVMSPMSHAKAEQELGWRPAPVTEAIAAGAREWVARRTARAGEREQDRTR